MEQKSNQYRRLAEELRERILSGNLQPAEKMPAERDLSAAYGVSRVTVRRALKVLEEEHLLTRLQGSGTYVSPHPERRIPLMIDYTGSMREHAPKLTRKLLKKEIVRADMNLGAAMRLPSGTQLLCIERVDSMDDTPVACDTGYIHTDYVDNLADEDFERVDFVEVWTRKADFPIETCRQLIEAAAADTVTAGRLQLPPGSPVLRSAENYHITDQVVAGRFISCYHPGFISISSTYRWKRGGSDEY